MPPRVLRYQREFESEVAARTAVMREDLEEVAKTTSASWRSERPVAMLRSLGKSLTQADFSHLRGS